MFLDHLLPPDDAVTGYDLHVTEQPSSQQVEPTTHTVIVQVLQAAGQIDVGQQSPLDRKAQPLLADGYRITHVSTCPIGGHLVLTTVVFEKKEDET